MVGWDSAWSGRCQKAGKTSFSSVYVARMGEALAKAFVEWHAFSVAVLDWHES
jgi:hypothetical protein